MVNLLFNLKGDLLSCSCLYGSVCIFFFLLGFLKLSRVPTSLLKDLADLAVHKSLVTLPTLATIVGSNSCTIYALYLFYVFKETFVLTNMSLEHNIRTQLSVSQKQSLVVLTF